MARSARHLTFGELLTQMRGSHGVFQRQVSDAADVALATVCDWEKARRNPPTSKRAFEIAKLFGSNGASQGDCLDLVVSSARTRGSFVFETENEHTLRLLAAICLKGDTLNANKVDRLINLL